MLLLEGLAQTAGALCMHYLEVKEPPLTYFTSIDKLTPRVRLGDVVYYRVEKIRSRGRVWRNRGRAVVDGTLVAQAEFSAAIIETTALGEPSLRSSDF